MDLYNDDCFNIFPKIKDKSIDLFVLDLPYANDKFGNCTDCSWDTPIDLEKMWEEIKRIMKPNATIIHFCNTKFGFSLIESNPKWFRYDLIWKKSKKVGFLSAKKQPLRQHENIYIFGDDSNENRDDLDLVRNKKLREYAKKVFKYIGKSRKEIYEKMGHKKVDHFFRFSSSQFALPIKKTYNELIEYYHIDKMEGFKTYKEMKDLEEKAPPKPQSTYNPQKTEGKPYTAKAHDVGGVYGNLKLSDIVNKGDRHPTSILEFNNPQKRIHPTQKPVDLLEWLIKSYSNEGDTVMDFTMGSGSCGVACKNTKRKFIGVEKDKEIFEKAKNRIDV